MVLEMMFSSGRLRMTFHGLFDPAIAYDFYQEKDRNPIFVHYLIGSS